MKLYLFAGLFSLCYVSHCRKGEEEIKMTLATNKKYLRTIDLFVARKIWNLIL